MAENSKAQEALQDAEELAAPPPAYEETASMVTETDDFQIIDRQDTLPDDEKRPIAGPSTSQPMDEKKSSDMPSRTPSMLKEKGPAYPPRPSNDIKTETKDEKDAITPVAESRDTITTLPTAEDEKKALQVHFAEEEAAPSLPRRPTATRFSEDFSRDNSYPNVAPPVLPPAHEASFGVPLTYTFAWHRPLLDFPTLQITPTNGTVIPSSFPDIPPTASWRLNYDSKYNARLHRYTATQTGADRHTSQAGDFPFRQVAEVRFPEFIIPGAGCGAVIKFDPHEEEVARLGNISNGKRPTPRIQKFMQCTGWLSTRYTMEVPVLDHLQATWKTIPRPKTTRFGNGVAETQQETAVVERKTTDIEREAKKRNVTLVTIGDLIDQARRTLNDETWTPYAPQQLIIEFDGRQVATYQRASPWAKIAGTLTIHQPEIGQVSVTPEFVEGIIIATTSMVGMQDRIGLASGLMEAANTSGKWSLNAADKSASWSAEQWKRATREWKARRASKAAAGGSGGGTTHPYGNDMARAQSEKGMYDQGGEVGSEVFDDGLAGVLTVEEREAARREQMAWDEKNRTQVTSVPVRMEPRDEVRRDTVSWDQKPKFVYA